MIDDQLLQQAIELATSRDQLQRRNERERNRVNRVNIAFENLRSKLRSIITVLNHMDLII